MLRLVAICCAALPIAAQALTLDLPGRPVVTHEIIDEAQTLILPTAAWVDGARPSQSITGLRVKRALRSAQKINVDATVRNLTEQMAADGYDVVYTCTQASCGGFEFTFAQDIIPPPAMFIDLGNYVFISAVKNGVKGATVIVSGTNTGSYFHVTTVNQNAKIVAQPVIAKPEKDVTIMADLAQTGKAVLGDLAFKSGSSVLEDGEYATVTELAEFLAGNPTTTVALVGHTDAKGSLKSNIVLSRNRAQAVRQFLTEKFDIDPARIEAEGIGYLAPITSNATASGRAMNRRVEVVVTNVAD